MILLSLALAGRFSVDDNLPGQRWRTVRTEHARIHFPAGEADWTASRVAAEVDPLWEGLCAAMRIRCEDRFDVVVLEDTDELEGFTLPASDWVVFSGHPGAELARMRGRVDWVPDLLAHELAHMAVARAADPYPRAMQGLGVDVGGVVDVDAGHLGGGVTLRHGMPYWFSEGSAEYWSEVVGVNSWTSARERLLVSAALEGRMLDPERWGSARLLDDWRDGERAYQEGYAFLRWFADEVGHDGLRAVHASSRRRTWPEWTAVFEDATGVPFEVWHGRFRAFWMARARGRQEAVRARGEVAGEELSTWTLAWQAEDLRSRDRWALRDPRDRLEQRERTGTLLLHARWSPDGRWFARQRSGWIEVREVDPGLHTVFAGDTPDWSLTRHQRRIARRHAAWFPASYGSSFAFVPGRDALVQVDGLHADSLVARARRDWNQLYLVDLTPRGAGEGSRLDADRWARRRRRRPLPGTARGFDPAVSPDGRRVAFARYEDGGSDLYQLELDTGEVTRLTHTEGVWWAAPSWSPDGSQLVATRHQGATQDLWLVDEAGASRPLLRTPWEEVDPYWATDGSIWFATDRTGVHDIHRWSDGIVHEMTRVVSGAQSPSLTPDGDLVYAHFTSFGWKTYARRASELAWTEVTADFVAPVAPEVPQQRRESVESRPYRAIRAVLPVAVSPSIRLDRTTDAWQPRVGAFIRFRDAVERHGVVLAGWVGADQAVDARYTFHGLWPDVSAGVSWARTRLPGESSWRVSRGWRLQADLPLRGETRVGVRLAQQELTGAARHTTRRATGRLSFGDAGAVRRLYGSGTTVEILPSLGWSNGRAPFARVELSATTQGWAPLGGRVGHRWFARFVGGWTSTTTAWFDQLPVGGDHPAALRPTRVEATIALPGYRPFARRGDRVAVVGGGWRLPLARRLAQAWGPVVVDGVALELGGDAAWLDGTVLADGTARLVVDTLFLGRRAGSSVLVAIPRRVGAIGGSPRILFSIGTGR
jgi:hypothetical protein